MEAWRRVEVAACEEIDGPDARPTSRRSARRRSPSRRSSERERITDHDVAAFVDVLGASAGPAGRWIHFGLTSLRRRSTPRSRCSCARAGEIVVRGRARAGRGARRARARARRHAVRRPHPRRARRADDVRAQARGLRASRRTATRERLERAFAQAAGRRALRRGRHLRDASARDFEARVLDAARARARAGLDAGRPARPPRRAAAGDRARRRRARALRHRDPPPAAHRGARGRGAVPRRARRARARCRTSATRSRPSASPASRACCAATRRPALENVALWHERDISHSGAERVILPDATILARLHAAPGAARRARAWSSTPTGCARTSSSRTARCSPSACCSRWSTSGMARDDAYRIVQEARAAARGTTRTPLRELLEREPRLELDLDAIFDSAAYVRYVPEMRRRGSTRFRTPWTARSDDRC